MPIKEVLMPNNLLEINQLCLGFNTSSGFTPVVHGVDLCVKPSEIVGILGESGSGKTVTLKALFGVAEEEIVIASGQIHFDQIDLMAMKEKEKQRLRGKTLSYIPQNASDALTPHQPIEKQLMEISKIHKVPLTKPQLIEKLKAVGIDKPEAILSMYPHQLSGGLAQRVVIAMSSILTPRLTVADEPTSAIDASLKSTVLKLLKHINLEDKTAMVIITHDFEVISQICDRVYVMYKGLIMETAPAKELLHNPVHPYTQGLLKCVQSITDGSDGFYAMKEAPDVPVSEQFLSAVSTVENGYCPFAPRCPKSFHKCFTERPPLLSCGFDHTSRCHLDGGILHE
jgi:peptide/nickel transport system ATP-binding protein